MGWESFDVVTFDLGPLLQGQMTTKLKNAYYLQMPNIEYYLHSFMVHTFSKLFACIFEP